MKPKHFLSHLQHEQIVKAIREAETRTNGRLSVFISHGKHADPVAGAQREFHIQRLDEHAGQNAILIFIAPRSHTFAVIGGAAIHEKCGDAFWEELTREMAAHLKSGSFTPAVLHAIRRAGEVLARHFPRT